MVNLSHALLLVILVALLAGKLLPGLVVAVAKYASGFFVDPQDYLGSVTSRSPRPEPVLVLAKDLELLCPLSDPRREDAGHYSADQRE